MANTTAGAPLGLERRAGLGGPPTHAPDHLAPAAHPEDQPPRAPKRASQWRHLTETEIRQRIRRLRGRLSVKQLADRVSMNPETVRRYLNGDSRIPAEFIARFAAAFRIDPARLLIHRPPTRDISTARLLEETVARLNELQARLAHPTDLPLDQTPTHNGHLAPAPAQNGLAPHLPASTPSLQQPDPG